MKSTLFPTVTGVVLAGGQSRRMNGIDKGLISIFGKPLVSFIAEALSPQVEQLYINTNCQSSYQSLNFPLLSDGTLSKSTIAHLGPLAGMLAVMQATQDDYILTVPCDIPTVSPKLRQRLMEGLLRSGSDIAIAHDGERVQPVFSLISTRLSADLSDYLNSGSRKVLDWFLSKNVTQVDFSDFPKQFINLNTPEDFARQLPFFLDKPVLGIAAYSGTGKTTLLTKLLPLLKQRRIRTAVIKHAHHKFDIDKPGKDSYQIREAGAKQVLVASSKLAAIMQKQHDGEKEPVLYELIQSLDHHALDLILVEGFKHEQFAKIELHRPSLGKPLIYKDDPNIIAIATDASLQDNCTLPMLDINNPSAIADFIEKLINSRIA